MRGPGLSFGDIEAEVGLLEIGGQGFQAGGKLTKGVGAQGDVAEFAAGAGRFAVEMQVRAGDGQDFGGGRSFADEIEHGGEAGGFGGAHRKIEDGAEMVFELAGDGAFNGPVTGIVDARGHFVGEEAALAFEKFDG